MILMRRIHTHRGAEDAGRPANRLWNQGGWRTIAQQDGNLTALANVGGHNYVEFG